MTTGGRADLVIAPDHTGVDDFIYQNGGSLISSDKTSADFDSIQNVAAPTYVKGLLSSGAAKFPSALSAGWNGEAFGENRAAMTIVGNWIVEHVLGLPEHRLRGRSAPGRSSTRFTS